MITKSMTERTWLIGLNVCMFVLLVQFSAMTTLYLLPQMSTFSTPKVGRPQLTSTHERNGFNIDGEWRKSRVKSNAQYVEDTENSQTSEVDVRLKENVEKHEILKQRGADNYIAPIDKTNNSSPGRVSFETHTVKGASEKQGNRFGFLKPEDQFVVPNIAHFIWFSCHPFKFENLVSMLSVDRIMKADKIFFHTDCEPTGEWWDEAVDLIQTLQVVPRTPPTAVFDRTLNPEWPEHAADVARLQILMEHGGVYFDTDVFVLAPLEPLRYYEYVVGLQSNDILSNGVILARKSSTFLKLYYESYKEYSSRCWSCTSVRSHHKLATMYFDLLHIEPDSMIQPSFTAWRELFLENYDWRSEHFTIHVWFREFYKSGYKDFKFTRENIKRLNTTVGEMCRYIYYGSPDIIP